jgi:uncharacterized membrane protein HdeD (DUF308 family)
MTSAPVTPDAHAEVDGKRLRRGWVWVMVDGVLGILAGVIALSWPAVTVLVLAVLLGISMLMQGIAEVSAASRAATGSVGRGWTAFLGVAAIVAGLICLFHPGAGLFAIIVGVTVWFLVAGAHELYAAFYLAEHRGWNLVIGVVTILLGIVMIAVPGLALSTAALLAGIFFLVRGAGEISLAMRLRRGEV